MKKTISLTLAVLMCLSLFSITAFAAAPSVSSNKTTYIRYETMTVTVSGDMPTDSCYVGIYVPGARADQKYSGKWEWVDSLTAGKWSVEAPSDVGDYELRLYDENDAQLMKTTFTVKYFIEKTATVVPDKTVYTKEEKMVVTVKGLEKVQEENGSFIGVYAPGARIDQHYGGKWEWISSLVNGKWNLEAPVEVGDYELRLYMDRDDENSLYLTVPFKVAYTTSTATLTLSKNPCAPEEKITVTVAGVTDAQRESGAFVGVYQPGARVEQTYGGKWEWIDSLVNGKWNLEAPYEAGQYEVRLYAERDKDDSLLVKITFTVGGAPWSKASDWALPELGKAQDYGLIPGSLTGSDFTKPITRQEFAGICVLLYENLTGEKTTAATTNPFTDTSSTDVLKAYNTNLMMGTAPDKFSPNVILNRETAATALTRVLKRAYIPGWTYNTDANYPLDFTMPAKFPDDAKISSWAYQSVYFMAANGIIKGMGNGNFAPKNTTSAETATGYANNTKEQALAIAVRIVENLKDKPLAYN